MRVLTKALRGTGVPVVRMLHPHLDPPRGSRCSTRRSVRRAAAERHKSVTNPGLPRRSCDCYNAAASAETVDVRRPGEAWVP